jgi:hypothetical protein
MFIFISLFTRYHVLCDNRYDNRRRIIQVANSNELDSIQF